MHASVQAVVLVVIIFPMQAAMAARPAGTRGNMVVDIFSIVLTSPMLVTVALMGCVGASPVLQTIRGGIELGMWQGNRSLAVVVWLALSVRARCVRECACVEWW